jgi:hypothetical protein
MTKRRRHTPDQIIRKLAEGHKLLAAGTELDESAGTGTVRGSERRAWRVVGQHRSTQRLDPPTISFDEVELRAFLRAFSKQRPRWGLRRAARAARLEGRRVNDKRIQRLWCDEGLRVPYRKRKKPHRGIGTAVGAMCPIAPNALWALDLQFDSTVEGRTLKLWNVVDEYTRECPAIVVDRSIDADRVVDCPDRLLLPAARQPSSGSTTVPSSSPTRWPTGAGSMASAAASSTAGISTQPPRSQVLI